MRSTSIRVRHRAGRTSFYPQFREGGRGSSPRSACYNPGLAGMTAAGNMARGPVSWRGTACGETDDRRSRSSWSASFRPGRVRAAMYRTSQGIGKGSTVNDVLGAYGKPVDILGERPRGPERRPRPGADPPTRQKYQYANPDDTVRTYFLVDQSRVTQVVINDLRPLQEHILKAPPKTN